MTAAGRARVEIDDEMVRHWAVVDKRSVRWIAAGIRCAPETVSRAFERLGIAAARRKEIDARTAARVARNAEIVASYRSGIRKCDVARAFAVDPAMVDRAIRAAEAAEERAARMMKLADLTMDLTAPTERRGRLVPTRVIGPGFGPGGGRDVEHADAALAAADAAPLWGGRYPKTPQPRPRSATGSPAALCLGE